MPATTRKGGAATTSTNSSRSVSGTPAPESSKRKKSTPAFTAKNARNKRQQTPDPPCNPALLKKVLEYHSKVTNKKGQNGATDETQSELCIWLIIL